MPEFLMVNDKTMESISVKPIRIPKKRVYHNPLRNPISSLLQWTASKAEDNGNEDIETGSCQPFLEKGCNPLLNPVSGIHEWRALMAKDTKPLKTDHHQQPLPEAQSHNSNPSFMEFDEEIAIDASFSCWLSSSSSSENIATK